MDVAAETAGAEGQFLPTEAPYNHTFYTHAQATIALCELYGMTKEPRYRGQAKKAVQFLLNIQHEDGAWRYLADRSEMSDLSVTGWVLMAFQSARMAGLDVPQDALDRISSYLDKNSVEDSTYYRYTIQKAYPSLSMTAEGILCRQYLGWSQTDPRMEKALDRVLKEGLVSFKNETDVYLWYYATQAMHHKEGRWWKAWNAVMRQEIPTHQVKTDPNAEAGVRIRTGSPTIKRTGSS